MKAFTQPVRRDDSGFPGFRPWLSLHRAAGGTSWSEGSLPPPRQPTWHCGCHIWQFRCERPDRRPEASLETSDARKTLGHAQRITESAVNETITTVRL